MATDRLGVAPRPDVAPRPGDHAEDGLGDTLRLARYAPLIEGQCGRVVLACQAELVPLLDRVDGVSEIVPIGGRLPPHSSWVPLPSLPR